MATAERNAKDDATTFNPLSFLCFSRCARERTMYSTVFTAADDDSCTLVNDDDNDRDVIADDDDDDTNRPKDVPVSF